MQPTKYYMFKFSKMQEIGETQAHNDKNNPPKALIAGSSNNG